jgi:pimeloyl-ACP methyl ester carboxylesterase
MRSQFVRANNINLHVMTDGPEDGTSVVLLHGFPEFYYGWRRQIPALAGAGFHVIAPDQRGYNLSDKPRGISSYDVNILARDIVGLFDHFGIQKARLVGHDWGAAVAWTVALNHPERLEKLAILNVPHPDVMARFILKDRAQQVKSWYIYFFQIPFIPEWALRTADYRALSRMLVNSGRRNTFTEENVVEYKKAWSQKGALTATINWYRAAFRGGWRSYFQYRKTSPRRVKVPTLVLWGRHDIALSERMAQPSIELCEDGRLVTFDRATHWVQHDQPEEVNQNLIEFLRS